MRGQVSDENRAGAWLQREPATSRPRPGRASRSSTRTGRARRRRARRADGHRAELDLWSGVDHAAGSATTASRSTVKTVAAPDDSTVAFRIESRTPRRRPAPHRAAIPLRASPASSRPRTGDAPTATRPTLITDGTSRHHRPARSTRRPTVWTSTFSSGSDRPERRRTSSSCPPTANRLDLVVRFARTMGATCSPIIRRDCAERRQTPGSASGCRVRRSTSPARTDARAPELERRIVLSQYLTAVNSRGRRCRPPRPA